MSSSENTKSLFVKENESKVAVTNRLKELFDSDYLIDAIFNKASNNKVGYYLFKDNKKYFRIYVLPKHIKIPKEDNVSEEKYAIKCFIDYLNIHHRLRENYPEKYDNNHKLGKTLFELGFTQDNNPYLAHAEIEEFVFYRLYSLLKQIENFFKMHKPNSCKLVSYSSQTVRHRFDLKKNIKELNKTKIHQQKYNVMSYSKIANITYSAIKLFIHNKLSLIENEEARENLRKLSRNIQRTLKKTFKVESGKRLTSYMLTSNRTYGYFRKKISSQQLYRDILSLFGWENFFEEDNQVDLNRGVKSEAFFLDPSILYEWYIYDKLITSANAKTHTIYFDKAEGTTLEYNMKSKHDIGCPKNKRKYTGCVESNPDFLLEKDNTLYTIDVKWKIKKDNIAFDLADVLKLKRDCEIRRQGKNIYAILIYPSVKESFIEEFLYNDGNSTFSFYVRQMAFEDDDIFDLGKITEKALDKNLTEQLIGDMQGLSHKRIDNIASIGIESDIAYGIIVDQLVEDLNLLRDKYSFDDSVVYEYYKYIKEFLHTYYFKDRNNLLESECVDFIKSTAYTATYFNKYMAHTEETLDYSLPASAIWKTIEIELNATVIHLIRYSQKICNRDSYYKRTDSQKTTLQIVTGGCSSVNLTEGGDVLKSCTLGSIGYILREAKNPKYDTKRIAQDAFSEFIRKEGSSFQLEKLVKDINAFVQKIKDSRNKHIHQKKMRFEDFEVLMQNTFQGKRQFDLANLMDLKVVIKKYMK